MSSWASNTPHGPLPQAHKLLHTYYVAGGPDKYDFAQAKEEEEALAAQGPAITMGTRGEVRKSGMVWSGQG